MEITGSDYSADYSLTAKRNCSISPSGLLSCFFALVVVSCGIAIGFALLGAWLIMPFAGLEILALGLAFYFIARHAGDYERITISGDRLIVESHECDHIRRWEFNRCWARVIMERLSANGRCRLALRSHGREVEFGHHLTDEERIAVARELRLKLGNG